MKTWNVTVSQLPGPSQSPRVFGVSPPEFYWLVGGIVVMVSGTGCILGLSEEAVGPPAYLPLDP